MNRLCKSCGRRFDRWLFESCDPVVCSVLRITYAILLIVYVSIWLLDASLWFSDAGVLRSKTADFLGAGEYWSLLFWLPPTPAVVTSCLAILLLQSVLLLAGFGSRFQAVCIFLWLTSFQHRNPLICDGEDTVFRWLIFFMIFMPLDYRWSLGRRWLPKLTPGWWPTRPANAWALRLVQLEVTAIYLSTAWCKWQGDTWQNGTALFYVSRMEDHFGRVWLPDFLFDTLWMVQVATWGVLVVESLLPFMLWIPATRRLAIAVGIALHLSIELTMHLFLFEWIMIVSLLCFAKPLRPARRKASQQTLNGLR